MPKTPARSIPRELTNEQYASLNFAAVRCTGCTPCCMSHTHFLYQGKVLWACQTKLERQAKPSAKPKPSAKRGRIS